MRQNYKAIGLVVDSNDDMSSNRELKAQAADKPEQGLLSDGTTAPLCCALTCLAELKTIEELPKKEAYVPKVACFFHRRSQFSCRAVYEHQRANPLDEANGQAQRRLCGTASCLASLIPINRRWREILRSTFIRTQQESWRSE